MGKPPTLPPTHVITTHNSPWGDHLSCEEEFTVVPRVPRAQTYSIPLEIYVPAAVVSSACADLEDNAVPGIMRGSNPLHTSRQLFRVRLCVCTCKPFTPCLRTSISVVNGERFPAFLRSQLPDFLQLWLPACVEKLLHSSRWILEVLLQIWVSDALHLEEEYPGFCGPHSVDFWLTVGLMRWF